MADSVEADPCVTPLGQTKVSLRSKEDPLRSNAIGIKTKKSPFSSNSSLLNGKNAIVSVKDKAVETSCKDKCVTAKMQQRQLGAILTL